MMNGTHPASTALGPYVWDDGGITPEKDWCRACEDCVLMADNDASL
ncbi:MAG: hypothetical protein JW829_03185 [Pirellulales bacterium]|nr:hypothetical protein [Pirellulales bacterium]